MHAILHPRYPAFPLDFERRHEESYDTGHAEVRISLDDGPGLVEAADPALLRHRQAVEDQISEFIEIEVLFSALSLAHTACALRLPIWCTMSLMPDRVIGVTPLRPAPVEPDQPSILVSVLSERSARQPIDFDTPRSPPQRTGAIQLTEDPGRNAAAPPAALMTADGAVSMTCCVPLAITGTATSTETA